MNHEYLIFLLSRTQTWINFLFFRYLGIIMDMVKLPNRTILTNKKKKIYNYRNTGIIMMKTNLWYQLIVENL